jgi:autotransporter-associated beta strand protein
MTLPRALLLAAASVLTLAVKATEYEATWFLDTGNTAKVIIGVDKTHPDWLANGYHSYYQNSNGWLTRFDVSIVTPTNQILASNTISTLQWFDWFIDWSVDGNAGLLNTGTNKQFIYFEAYNQYSYIFNGNFDSFQNYGTSWSGSIPSFSIYSGSPPPPAPTTITTTINASDARVTGGNALQFQGGAFAPGGGSALSLTNAITVLASSTGTLDATSQDITSTGAVTINGTSLTLAGSANSVISLAGLVSGTGGLINDGGVNTLAQSSTYTGATVVNAGKLIQVGTSESSSNQIAAGATLEFNQASGSVSSGNTTFTGAGILLKTGAGSLGWGVTSATFSFSHGAMIHVAEGNFIGGSNWSEVWTDNHSDLRVEAGARFSGVEADVRIDRLLGAGVVSTGLADPRYHGFTTGVDGGDGFFTGTIIDSDTDSGALGKIIKVGGGELTLTGINTYGGGTTLQAGALRAGNNAAFGSGTISLNAGVLSSDGSAARTLANEVHIAGDVTLGDAVKDGALTLAGAVSVSSGTIITFASDVTLSGTATSTGVFTKAGTGVLTLDAAGTIAAGTLVVSGGLLTNNGAINGDVTVASGSTLNGTGTVTGLVTIAGTGAAGQAGALVFDLGASPIISNSAVGLSGDAKIGVTAMGVLYLNGAIDASAAGKVLTIDTGLGVVFQRGQVGTNVAQLVKEGGGWLNLRDSVAGAIVLNQGACSAGVAGSTGTGVTVNAGASLWLSSAAGTPITFAAPLSLNGSYALHLDSTAAVTQSGQVTLVADTTIASLSANHVISGGIAGATPGQNLTLQVDDHSLTLTGTTAASIAQLTKTGAGTLLVDTTGLLDAASIVISDGLVTNNGTITGTISVTGNGVLGGSGTINGAVTINGILAPGNSPGIQIQASGDTTLATGAHYQAQLGGTTPGNGDGFHDQYDVQAGRLFLDPGVTLDVLPWVMASPNNTTNYVPKRTDVFTILKTTGGISGVFSDITNANGSQWVLFDNAPTTHLLGKLYGTGLNGNETFAAYGSTPARAALGASLWSAAVTASTSSTNAHPAGFIDGDTAFGQIAIALLTAPDADAFLDGLSPSAYLAVGDYALTVSRSLTDAAFAQSSLIRTGAWTVGAGYNRAEHGYAGANTPSYSLSSDTSLVTVAYDFSPNCSVGFFFGQNRGKTTAETSRIDYRGSVFGLTSVGRINGAYPVTLKGALVASDLELNATRGGSASGAQKLRSFGGQLTASAEIYKDGRLTVSPTLGFVQGRSTTSAFAEAGTGANLTIDAMAQDSSRVVAGFGLTYLASTNLVFDLSAAFEHEYAADAGSVSATFGGVGTPLTVTRPLDDRDSTTCGLGASWKLDNSTTVRLGAEVRGNRELRKDYRYNASVNVRF